MVAPSHLTQRCLSDGNYAKCPIDRRTTGPQRWLQILPARIVTPFVMSLTPSMKMSHTHTHTMCLTLRCFRDVTQSVWERYLYILALIQQAQNSPKWIKKEKAQLWITAASIVCQRWWQSPAPECFSATTKPPTPPCLARINYALSDGVLPLPAMCVLSSANH